MSRATISVVIPTYNSGPLVTQAVDSVLAQTVVPDEIIVVDDGSRDDTRERLASYPDRVRYLFQENQGVSAARNMGVRQAKGELVAFLDSDDFWHPRKIELQLRELDKNPNLGLLGTGVFDWPAARLPDVGELGPGSLQIVDWRRLVVKNYFTTSSLLVRRRLLEQAGPFDTDLQGPEDYDLWLRVAETAAVANLDLPLTGYRTVEGSLSKQAARMQAGMRRILEKLDERGAWRAQKGSGLLRRKAYSYFYYSCAYMHDVAGNRGIALGNMVKSLAWYPFAYRRDEVRMAFARPKMLIMILARMLRGSRREARPMAVRVPTDGRVETTR